MKKVLLQYGHSHASCVSAVTLAVKALLEKIPKDPKKMRDLQLTKEELELIDEVIAKFGKN